MEGQCIKRLRDGGRGIHSTTSDMSSSNSQPWENGSLIITSLPPKVRDEADEGEEEEEEEEEVEVVDVDGEEISSTLRSARQALECTRRPLETARRALKETRRLLKESEERERHYLAEEADRERELDGMPEPTATSTPHRPLPMPPSPGLRKATSSSARIPQRYREETCEVRLVDGVFPGSRERHASELRDWVSCLLLLSLLLSKLLLLLLLLLLSLFLTTTTFLSGRVYDD